VGIETEPLRGVLISARASSRVSSVVIVIPGNTVVFRARAAAWALKLCLTRLGAA
jgi:hypothetical protein